MTALLGRAAASFFRLKRKIEEIYFLGMFLIKKQTRINFSIIFLQFPKIFIMTLNQGIAVVIAGIFRFGFSTSLLIISKSNVGRMSKIANVIVFAALCPYLTKFKFCPDVSNHVLLAVIESSLFVIIIEFLMSLWSSLEFVVNLMVKSSLIDLTDPSIILAISDMIVMGMAVCIFLTAMIEIKVIEKAMEYYRKNGLFGRKQCPTECVISPQRPKPSPKRQSGMSYLDSNCPIHGKSSHHF